jgi:hypothetical protein
MEAEMQLKIAVTGACGISPRKSDHRVLTPSADALPEHGVTGAEMASMNAASLPEHLAFMQFDKNQAGLTAVRPLDFSKYDAVAQADFGFFIFRSEHIAIRYAGGGQPPPFPPFNGGDDKIVSMAKVLPGSDTADDVLVTDDFSPDSKRVSSTFDLPGGDISADKFDPRDVFEFKPHGAKRYYRPFAREVVYSINLTGGPWEIKAQSFGRSSPENPVLHIDAQATIKVTFGNAPLVDILTLEPNADDEIDHHFLLLYGLLEDFPTTTPLPRRISPRRASRAGGANCPPAMFS